MAGIGNNKWADPVDVPSRSNSPQSEGGNHEGSESEQDDQWQHVGHHGREHGSDGSQGVRFQLLRVPFVGRPERLLISWCPFATGAADSLAVEAVAMAMATQATRIGRHDQEFHCLDVDVERN